MKLLTGVLAAVCFASTFLNSECMAAEQGNLTLATDKDVAFTGDMIMTSVGGNFTADAMGGMYMVFLDFVDVNGTTQSITGKSYTVGANAVQNVRITGAFTSTTPVKGKVRVRIIKMGVTTFFGTLAGEVEFKQKIMGEF